MVMSDLPNGKALAKCFYVEEDNKYTLNQRVCSFTSNNGNVSRFLMYQINRNKYYLRFDDGINQTNLKKSEVLSCPVFIPIVREQEKIVTLLCKIDERIATQNKVIDKLQSLIKGIVDCTILRKEKNAIVGDVCSISEQIRAEANIDDIITVRLHGNGVCKSSAENLQLGATQYYRRRAGQLIYGKQNFRECKINCVRL